eukprot:5543518-Amphidinium_carterae.2
MGMEVALDAHKVELEGGNIVGVNDRGKVILPASIGECGWRMCRLWGRGVAVEGLRLGEVVCVRTWQVGA